MTHPLRCDELDVTSRFLVPLRCVDGPKLPLLAKARRRVKLRAGGALPGPPAARRLVHRRVGSV